MLHRLLTNILLIWGPALDAVQKGRDSPAGPHADPLPSIENMIMTM
jgi:hypothetical protein